MTTLVELLLVLAAARLVGGLVSRLGHPSTVGELLAGLGFAALALTLGSSVPFLEALPDSRALHGIADVAIFLIILNAAVELEPREIAEHSRESFAVAIGGMLVPLAAGFAFAWALLPPGPLAQPQAFLVGIAMAVTAIPVSVKVLGDLGLLHARIGETVVAAAIFDDVISLVLLAILTAMIATGNLPGIGALGLLLAKVALFFLVTRLLGVHVYPTIARRLRLLDATAVEFSALAIVGLAYGVLAELLGMHWIMGAFMAGLYFEKSRVGAVAHAEMRILLNAITAGVLAPLYFAWIGMRVELDALFAVPLLVMALTLTAFGSKLLGSGLAARWAGLNTREAASVGVAMNARGAVELVILQIALDAGLFRAADGSDPFVANLFSALVVMSAVTTLAAPILLRLLNGSSRRSAGARER
jgi:Kef-type K+ transport system membrane component KefB